MHSIKVFFALMLALVLAAVPALSDEDPEARIAELEAELAEARELIEFYYPYYEMQVVAEYDGGVLMLNDVRKYYSAYEEMYAGYGLKLSDYYAAGELELEIIMSRVEYAVISHKAEELGISGLTESVLYDYEMQAEAVYQDNMDYMWEFYADDERSDAEIQAEIDAYLELMGYTKEALYQSYIESHVYLAVYDYFTASIGAAYSDIESKYEELVAADQVAYQDNHYNYEAAYATGNGLYWNPDNARQVWHILIAFTDEQEAIYSQLMDERDDLNALLAEVPEGETAIDGTPVADIEARIEAINGELDALYAALMPEADAVYARLDAGEEFAAVMADSCDDEGMLQEPGLSKGYAVCSDSTYYERAFRDAAWALESPGDVSEPVRCKHGLHIIYYGGDIAPGAVSLDDVYYTVADLATSGLVSDAYEAGIAGWLAEVNPVYYPERFLH